MPTNEYGFQGLPGGWRLNLGDFFYIHENGFWWTKSDDYLPGGLCIFLWNSKRIAHPLPVMLPFKIWFIG